MNIFGAMIFGFLFGGIISGALVDNYWRNDAVNHNKAEYYLDNNNYLQWRWKE